MNLKGLIKYIKWDDASRRGEIGQSAIILLFQEIDDVIFYKYLNELSIPFNNLTQSIINLEKSNSSREDFISVLEHLEFNITSLLEELKLQEISEKEKEGYILYLGDHDPSGLDMVRDITDRLNEFGVSPMIDHIAITQEQIKKYSPPPNPAAHSLRRAPPPAPGWTAERQSGQGPII